MSIPRNINRPLNDYTTKILKMYLEFPKEDSFTVLDWKARDGRFLNRLTDSQMNNRFLYAVENSRYNCNHMRDTLKFHRVAQSDYRSEAKITNDAFSMVIIDPTIEDRLLSEVFETVDPYNMPNFETEIRAQVEREEEKKRQLKEQMAEQIDFGELNEDNSENTKVKEETEEEQQIRINKKIRTELEKRVKAWRMAMKAQAKQMSSMRWDSFLLQRATTYLQPGGILVMITPKEFIDDTITFKLVNQYEDIKILRLDDDEYHEQRKCIILAKKRRKATREDYVLGQALSRTKEKPYRSFGEVREVEVSPDHENYERQVLRQKVDSIYGVIEPQLEPSYVVPISDPEEITSFRVGPITAGEALVAIKKSKLINTYQDTYSQVFTNKDPVAPTPLHKGHIMLLLTSGLLNGYIGTGPDQHLVKGSAVKDIREFSETDEDGNTKIVEREFYNIGVKYLNNQGEFRKIM